MLRRRRSGPRNVSRSFALGAQPSPCRLGLQRKLLLQSSPWTVALGLRMLLRPLAMAPAFADFLLTLFPGQLNCPQPAKATTLGPGNLGGCRCRPRRALAPALAHTTHRRLSFLFLAPTSLAARLLGPASVSLDCTVLHFCSSLPLLRNAPPT